MREERPRPLLVGELNPYGMDPYYALYPLPEGASGDRLCRRVLGITHHNYLKKFDRANLCAGKWSIPRGREAARQLLCRERWKTIVLLGSRVRAAFGVEVDFFRSETVDDVTFVSLPHPSGRNLVWNDPDAPRRARLVLFSAGVEL